MSDINESLPKGITSQVKDPLIKSGINKGRIRNPDVAHEVYNTIEEARKAESGKKKDKVAYFNQYGDDKLLVRQADKTVTREKELANHKKLAELDPLTGLHNKASFPDYVAESLQSLREGEYKGIAVMLMDFDYFSWLNDILEAHAIGDLYLSAAGSILRDELRIKSDIGFRAGGDEFGAIIRNTLTSEDCNNVIKRLYTALNTQVLSKTLSTILSSNRHAQIEGGKKEKESTIALKQFLIGLRNLKENEEGRKDHFFSHGRGEKKAKDAFIKRLEEVDFTKFEEYLNDKRTYEEIEAREEIQRKNLEVEAVGIIEQMLSPVLGISMAGMYIPPDFDGDFPFIYRTLDNIVSLLKRRGGKLFQMV